MTVYLDDANVAWRGKRWCHLYAESLPALLAFADGIGLRRSWLQHADCRSGLPHFDVTGSMLAAARRAGAVEPPPGTYRRLRRALAAGEYPLA